MLTQAQLKSILHYDPETGWFTWLHSRRGPIVKGRRAGSMCRVTCYNYYRKISINGTGYYEHRLAFLYMCGEWPLKEVDHINGDGIDNRYVNLRLCDRGQNSRNTPKLGAAGFRGVARTPKGRWYARIMLEGRHAYLGVFDTPEEAQEAYLKAAEEYHGEFAAHKSREGQILGIKIDEDNQDTPRQPRHPSRMGEGPSLQRLGRNCDLGDLPETISNARRCNGGHLQFLQELARARVRNAIPWRQSGLVPA